MLVLPDPAATSNEAPEGERRRDESLNLLRARRAELIRAFTAAALRVALDRGEVCADDVRPLVTIPPEIDPVFIGVVFKDLAHAGILRPTGIYRRSCRAVAHARPNPVWRLADAAGASAALAALTTTN